MKSAFEFLRALGNLLSAGALYGSKHPVLRRGLEAAYVELATALTDGPRLTLSFLDEEIVVNDEPLHELRAWPWSRRMSTAGVQRLEISPGATLEEFEGFVHELASRLDQPNESFRPGPHPSIRFGAVGLRDGAGSASRAVDALAHIVESAAEPLALDEEAQTLEWVHDQTRATGQIPVQETAAVIRGLSVAMHDVKPLIAPLIELKFTDQYTTAHCINVALLSMSLAEFLQYSHEEVHAIGEAALLHDIGKTRIPLEVTNKPGKLTPEERLIIERHPSEGARILMQQSEDRALASVVAYEHHMHWQGLGGYPVRHVPRTPHTFSRLVQVCDVFDALRTRRPFRPPVAAEAALLFIEQRGGTEFDPSMVSAFVRMMRDWEPMMLAKEAVEEGKRPVELSADELARIDASAFDADTETASKAA